MYTTIFIVLLLVVAVLLALLAPRITWSTGYGATRERHRLSRVFSLIPLALALIVLAFSCTAIVQAKTVGVVTSFGKPIGTESSGLSVKLPWHKVTEVDGTIQTDEYRGEDGCISVRIGDGSRSCVTLTNRWEIVDDKADVIYADYRSDDPTKSLRDAVVSTQLKAAVQEVLAGYNPIGELEVVKGSNAAAASELNFAPDYGDLSQQVLEAMSDRSGSELIDIKDITISYVSLSDSTQRTIDDFIKAVGETRIAAQARNTATEQAAANRTIQASLEGNSEGVLVSRCIDALNSAVEKDYALPAGFNCLGSGSAVVVPSK